MNQDHVWKWIKGSDVVSDTEAVWGDERQKETSVCNVRREVLNYAFMTLITLIKFMPKTSNGLFFLFSSIWEFHCAARHLPVKAEEPVRRMGIWNRYCEIENVLSLLKDIFFFCLKMQEKEFHIYKMVKKKTKQKKQLEGILYLLHLQTKKNTCKHAITQHILTGLVMNVQLEDMNMHDHLLMCACVYRYVRLACCTAAMLIFPVLTSPFAEDKYIQRAPFVCMLNGRFRVFCNAESMIKCKYKFDDSIANSVMGRPIIRFSALLG